MLIDFTGFNVLISGSSRGIGCSVAIAFAESGANVIIHYNNDLKAARETLHKLSKGKHTILKADLSVTGQIESLASAATEVAGRIDILINNAGIYEELDISRCSADEWVENWNKTLAINLTGAAHLSFLMARQMIKNGGGKIVNISSRGAFRGEPSAIAYGASKAGMNAMSQSMAKALAPHGVYIYTLAPGFVETDMAAHLLEGKSGDSIKKQSPLGRVAKPEEVANAVLLLASKGTEYMTGCILDINGASYLRT